MYTLLHTSTVSTCVYLQSFLHGPQPSQLLLQFDTHLCTEQHKVVKQGRQHKVHRHSNCAFQQSPSIHKYRVPFPAGHTLTAHHHEMLVSQQTSSYNSWQASQSVGAAIYGSEMSVET